MLSEGSLPVHRWAKDHIRHFARTASYHGQPIIFSEIGGLLYVPSETEEDMQDRIYKVYNVSTSTDSEEAERLYDKLMGEISQLPFLAGFCYTQLTDIEQEKNGLLTYDRQPKFSQEKVSAWNKKLISDYIARKAG